MQTLSDAPGATVDEIGRRHGFGAEASRVMVEALRRGGGRMAQFAHPEFGGRGQWMSGGMTMLSAMFDDGLKRRVAALCDELAEWLADHADPAGTGATAPAAAFADDDRPGSSAPPRRGAGWPASLGQPSSSGSQNDLRYAVFDATRRLAIERAGRVTVHDTLDHRIGGVSQQQGASDSLRFTSQHGPIDLATLPVVSDGAGDDDTPSARRASGAASAAARDPFAAAPTAPAATGHAEIGAALETLADLRDKGILGAAEFDAKKAELLARL